MSNPYKKYFSKIRTSESSGDDYATNPNGAAGRYQFLPSIWTRMGYDIKDIYNPKLQEEAAQRFTDFNANYLRKGLGIEPTDADLYGAHFLGAAGYSQLYKTPNNAPISTVMSPREISSNPFVKGKSVGFVKNWLAKKMNQPGVEYDDTESSETVYNPITPEQQAALDAYVAQATAMTQEKIAKENYKSELAKQELEQKQKEQNFLSELNATFRNAKDKQEMAQAQPQGDGSEYNLAQIQKPTLQTIPTPMFEYKKGGFVVTRSSDRKGKTHKVTSPDGTVKYFGDSKLGQHPGDPKRKAAFYARHKKNLKNNPYFRAFARATWQEGGEYFGENMNKNTDYPPYNNETDEHRTAMRGMMKAKMAGQAALGNRGAQRMMSHNPQQYTFTGEEVDNSGIPYGVPSGEHGTHFIADLDNYTFPLIQDRGDGKLYFNNNASVRDREAMRFETPEEAEYFARHYKDKNVAPMMQEYWDK